MKKTLSLVLVLALAFTCLASVAMADIDPSTLDPYEIEWYTLGDTANSEDVAASLTEPVVMPRIWQAARCERKVRELGCEK